MIIKKWNQFIKESANGTELIMPNTPNMPDLETPSTLSTKETDILFGIDGNFYTWDDYQDLHNQYLKLGGFGLSDFTRENLDIILDFLSKETI